MRLKLRGRDDQMTGRSGAGFACYSGRNLDGRRRPPQRVAPAKGREIRAREQISGPLRELEFDDAIFRCYRPEFRCL